MYDVLPGVIVVSKFDDRADSTFAAKMLRAAADQIDPSKVKLVPAKTDA